jgi:hypothetical protein
MAGVSCFDVSVRYFYKLNIEARSELFLEILFRGKRRE